MDEFEIAIRPGVEADHAFIYATWLRNYRLCSYFAKRIRSHIFFKWHHELIKRILERKTTTTLIACSKQDPDLILGYLIFEDWQDYDVLHFIYVKSDYQHQGIAHRLMNESR